MFPCTKCGKCCRQVGKTIYGFLLADNTGACKYLNKKNNLCTIYNHRPVFCNVDEYFEKYFSDKMSKEEFYLLNKNMCNTFQS